jgi:hypothetical protein
MAEPQKITIQTQVEWRAKRSATSERWIGECEALNLSMEADTLDELHGLIPETIHLLMVDLLEDNELDRYLKEKGWRAIGIPAKPDGDIEFDVPWYLVAEGARGSQRRAY